MVHYAPATGVDASMGSLAGWHILVVEDSVADDLAARNIPFAFATGYEPATVPPRHRTVPLRRKPFDVDDLVARIRAAAGERSRRAALSNGPAPLA